MAALSDSRRSSIALSMQASPTKNFNKTRSKRSKTIINVSLKRDALIDPSKLEVIGESTQKEASDSGSQHFTSQSDVDPQSSSSKNKIEKEGNDVFTYSEGK